MTRCSATLLLAAGLLGGGALSAQESAARQNQAVFAEWIAAEKLISEERAKWMLEQQIMADSIAALKAEREKLQGEIKASAESASAAEEARRALASEKDGLQATADAIRAALEGHTASLAALAPRLPGPLQADLQAPLARLLSDREGERVPLGVRMQLVVGILTEIDAFNRKVNPDKGIQELPDGTKAEVVTLYFGLGAAYFGNEAGTVAGVGTPGPQGWTFTSQEGLKQTIQQLMAVNNRTRPAEFAPLPLAIVD